MFKKILLVSSLLLTPTITLAQVAPATHGGNTSLWVGGQYSTFKPDFNVTRLQGIGIYADYTLTPRFAAEAEARFSGVLVSEDLGETQKDYLIGPSARLYTWNHFSANAKFLLGGVWIKYPSDIAATGSYFAYSPGGNVNYRLNHRWSARADYEYHILPSAPGLPGPSHGLTPNGWSFGVAYKVF